jgi:hypothetical protein
MTGLLQTEQRDSQHPAQCEVTADALSPVPGGPELVRARAALGFEPGEHRVEGVNELCHNAAPATGKRWPGRRRSMVLINRVQPNRSTRVKTVRSNSALVTKTRSNRRSARSLG